MPPTIKTHQPRTRPFACPRKLRDDLGPFLRGPPVWRLRRLGDVTLAEQRYEPALLPLRRCSERGKPNGSHPTIRLDEISDQVSVARKQKNQMASKAQGWLYRALSTRDPEIRSSSRPK